MGEKISVSGNLAGVTEVDELRHKQRNKQKVNRILHVQTKRITKITFNECKLLASPNSKLSSLISQCANPQACKYLTPSRA